MLGKPLIKTSNVITLLLCGFILACKLDPVGFGPLPEIQLRKVELLKNRDGKDSVIQVTLYFQDGDGDIGLSETDTISPFNFGSIYFHNLPVTYLVPDSIGEYSELINPNSNQPYGNQHERVPVLTPTSKYKAISGDLIVNLTANPIGLRPEKVILEMKLLDRELNVSNTVATSVIDLTH